MPAPITSSSPTSTVNKAKLQPRGATQGKKTRLVRRRGRANGVIDSDEEIEREARTDSESEDNFSSDDSETESEPEDSRTNGSPHPLTPSTSQSPHEVASISKETVGINGKDSFFASSGNWSEMVAEETSNGPSELPVIDFSELESHVVTVPPRKPKKSSKKDSPAPQSDPQPTKEETSIEETATPAPHHHHPNRSIARRPHGQSARQAYQQRLESDPSYVPTVGEFWGHDDRLLDKDLRSLSGWWRGQWQGRGRGRGRGFIRGQGAFMGRPPVHKSAHSNPDDDDGPKSPELPPVERPWTHDGFEEMKRNEDRRRSTQEQIPSQPAIRGAAIRGRGGFPLRGRGGRGAFLPSIRPQSPSGGSRVWYHMKPERMWTKQSEYFLYLDRSLKARHGHAAGIRVKLPGEHSQVAKLPLKDPAAMTSPKPAVTSTISVTGSDYGGHKNIVVRLPKRHGKEKATESAQTSVEEPSIEEVFTVRPRLISPKPIPLPEPSSSKATSTNPPVRLNEPRLDPVAALEQLSIEPQRSDPQRFTQTEEAILRNPPSDTHNQDSDPSSDSRPDLAPIQTSFTPPIPQGSPAFGSPYAFAPPLPPGVAMNAVGMPFEVATGRPVYLQPPAVYNPRPAMPPPPAVPFVPGHMHHRSTSDFAQPSPPPPNGFIDYSTGQPFFSFPRQSSAIEIRYPDGRKPMENTRPTGSGLRSSAATFEPSRQTENGYFPPVDREYGDAGAPGAPGEDLAQPPEDNQMMGYNPYQYYYPDSYGYAPYMDMSQMGQQYGVYQDPNIPQGTVYY